MKDGERKQTDGERDAALLLAFLAGFSLVTLMWVVKEVLV